MILVRVSFNTVGLFGDMTSKGFLADWRAVTAHSASAEGYLCRIHGTQSSANRGVGVVLHAIPLTCSYCKIIILSVELL